MAKGQKKILKRTVLGVVLGAALWPLAVYAMRGYFFKGRMDRDQFFAYTVEGQRLYLDRPGGYHFFDHRLICELDRGSYINVTWDPKNQLIATISSDAMIGSFRKEEVVVKWKKTP